MWTRVYKETKTFLESRPYDQYTMLFRSPLEIISRRFTLYTQVYSPVSSLPLLVVSYSLEGKNKRFSSKVNNPYGPFLFFSCHCQKWKKKKLFTLLSFWMLCINNYVSISTRFGFVFSYLIKGWYGKYLALACWTVQWIVLTLGCLQKQDVQEASIRKQGWVSVGPCEEERDWVWDTRICVWSWWRAGAPSDDGVWVRERSS